MLEQSPKGTCCPGCGSHNIAHNSWCQIHKIPVKYHETILHFIDGILHQRHDDGHGVAGPVWVPVPSTTADPKAADVPDDSAAS